MKFRLFGGQDCSDFLLAQLAVVAVASVDVIEPMTEHAVATVQSAGGGDGASSVGGQDVAVEDLTNELLATDSIAAMGLSDAATAMVAIHSLVSNIVRFQVPADVSVKEMTMLGLSKETAECIMDTTARHVTKLRQRVLENPPARPGISVAPENVSVWSNTDTGSAVVKIELQPTRSKETTAATTLEMSPEQLRALLGELVLARETLRQAVE